MQEQIHTRTQSSNTLSYNAVVHMLYDTLNFRPLEWKSAAVLFTALSSKPMPRPSPPCGTHVRARMKGSKEEHDSRVHVLFSAEHAWSCRDREAHRNLRQVSELCLEAS